MRKTAWVLTGLMVVSAAAAMAATAPAGDMSKDKGTMAAPAADSKPMTKAKSGSVKGEVTAVDATAKTITVKGKTGDTTATWDDKTTITPKGKTSGDIKVGDSVTVWYKADGDTKTVTKIAMHPAKAMKKAM
jgi:streptogramin lyase